MVLGFSVLRCLVVLGLSSFMVSGTCKVLLI